MDLKTSVERYIKSIQDVKTHGNELCKILVDNLKEVIPDLKCTLGWAEAGADTICLWSDSRQATSMGIEKMLRMWRLEKIVEDEVPQLKGYVDAPYGVYITTEEAEKVRQILRKLRGTNKWSFT